MLFYMIKVFDENHSFGIENNFDSGIIVQISYLILIHMQQPLEFRGQESNICGTQRFKM